MANSYLTRTTSSPTNADKITFSAWIKKSKVSGNMSLIADYGSSTNRGKLQFSSADKLEYYQVDGGSATSQLRTNRLFRDVNAWYHILFQYDSSQSTASDRLKFYINGIQETSFEIATYPSQNQDSRLNKSGVTLNIGQEGDNGNYFDGYMSHVALVDGSIVAPTVFGETDSTSGIWKFKSPSGVTWGTNGFHLKMENSGAMGTDSSGNTNTFTVNGNLKQALDTPSNVYATLNPLVSITDAPTFSNGNNSIVISNAGGFGSQSTLGMSSGKYYAEFKMTASSDNDMAVGVNSDTDAPRTDSGAGFGSNSTGYRETGTLAVNGTEDISYGNSYTVNDIIGIAIDLDNNKLYFSKNGTWQNSGDPTSGATGTGALSLTAASSTSSGFYFFNPSCHSGSQGGTWQANFGNGYFGTTAVSSNSGNGYSGTGSLGIFQYQPPTGYTALSTKGLNL